MLARRVVLRAVLFVEVCAGVGVGFAADTFLDWVIRLALVTGGTLPATLAWLLVACVSKRCWRVWPGGAVRCSGGLGALAGCMAVCHVGSIGLVGSPPWVASAVCGALLSSLLVAALVLRSKGHMPAHTSARLAELQSRIRPHFLFNTLNSAIALVRAEPAKAEALLEDLSDLFREHLRIG
jgi:two-component system sensor histidine kinase AlgZ